MIPTTQIIQRIKQGAIELYYRHGIRSITMDDISGHLGISKKTLYQNFKNKSTLVRVLMEEEIESQCRDIDHIHRESENPVDELMLSMKYMASKLGQMNPNLFYDLQKYYPASWMLFRKFKETQLISFIEENLKKGIRHELYRKDLPIKILARLRLQEIDCGFDPSIYPPGQFHIQEVHLALLDHFLHGIVTLKGHRLINKYKQITESE
ncbi:MAG: TetR/AcrR family transcriptional regulator [Bacteroidia bacterium]|nr:TetR/AcrR family transcriptional regulator [Bacteroidia bacterium]